jgi:hypothetical protein
MKITNEIARIQVPILEEFVKILPIGRPPDNHHASHPISLHRHSARGSKNGSIASRPPEWQLIRSRDYRWDTERGSMMGFGRTGDRGKIHFSDFSSNIFLKAAKPASSLFRV